MPMAVLKIIRKMMTAIIAPNTGLMSSTSWSIGMSVSPAESEFMNRAKPASAIMMR